MKVGFLTSSVVVRAGVEVFLRTGDFEVAQEFDEGSASMSAGERCDVVVAFWPSSLADVCLKLRAAGVTQPIVLITERPLDALTVGIFKQLGVRGLLSLEFEVEKLHECLKVAASGGNYFDAAAILTALRASDQEEGGKSLPQRQLQVFKLLAEGMTVREIGLILRLSPKTIEAHKFQLMRRIDVHNKAQLVTAAYRMGILRLED